MRQPLFYLLYFFAHSLSLAAPKCDTELLIKMGYTPKEGVGDAFREFWPVDGPLSVKKDFLYENDFAQILSQVGVRASENYFENFLRDRRAAERSTHVLDLFGSCFFIENQSAADSLTGLRFGPFDRSKLPPGYAAEKIPTEVLGDIFNGTTWEKLDASMKARAIPAMDLVAMRPFGGWSTEFRTAEQNLHAVQFIVDKVTPRLSSSGRFYFSVPVPSDARVSPSHPLIREMVKDAEKKNRRIVLRFNVHKKGNEQELHLDGAVLPEKD